MSTKETTQEIENFCMIFLKHLRKNEKNKLRKSIYKMPKFLPDEMLKGSLSVITEHVLKGTFRA